MMFIHGASVLVALIVAINASETRRHKKIIGGSRDSVWKRPYMVSVYDGTGHTTLCSGSIISRHHVLTALHCAENTTAAYYVRSSSDSATANGTVTRVRHVFRSIELDLDVAVLLLDGSLNFGDKCQPIVLANDSLNLSEYREAVVIGYGRSDFLNEAVFGDLRSANVTLIDRAECRKKYDSHSIRELSPNEFCTLDRNAIKGFCQGDSGGPLVVRDGGHDVQVGVVSWTKFCGHFDSPAVYVNVSIALPWINEVMARDPTLRQYEEKGGQFDFIKNHPYMVSISEFISDPHCAGSIVSPRHILTSRTCVPDVDYQVRSASETDNFGKTTVVSRIYLHASIDAAILLLKKPLQFGENCTSITLSDKPYQQYDVEKAIAPGWGMKKKRYFDHYLRSVFVELKKPNLCGIFYKEKNLSSHEICGAFYWNRDEYCFVDRGGPLVTTVKGQKVQIGIASWSKRCDITAYPYVYVDISSVKKWIDTIVKETQNLM